MHHLFVSLLLASCITLVAPQVSFDSDRSEALSIFRHWDLFKSKRSQGGSNSNLNVHSCATQQSWLEVSKEEHSASTGQLIRICHGRLQVAKCEGSCLSNLRPSINTLTGLIKECICCREGEMRAKETQLDRCFDSTGNALPGDTMTITLQEPHECACLRCDK